MIDQKKHDEFWFAVGGWLVRGALYAALFFGILLPAFRYWTQ